ncbi:unnamed protein product [Hymenolepis diminuta]|uniref:Grh/CP2 DB domain-containing protein n=1 Tax=Hymenolepis diminuta TaxID=6216 RepID=A0A564YU29_HYMDI|nr:unnamed protein product [Hymenolepis diminuta]
MDSESGYDFILEEPTVEVDSTLLSLNSDMSDTMFNMSDALHALPSDLQLTETENDAQMGKRKSKNVYYPYTTPLTIELKAITSPATLLSEDSLTYLNQDQPYTIEISDSHGDKPAIIKSVVRICFYQERIQVNEAKHLAFWRDHHPGERMLDIDHDGCFNCRSVYADPGNLNAIICVWHSAAPCRISLKAHCVSTEFTAKKHGGEKGVPFRLQVDSFRECDNSHIYSAACQVKVFKPKGADRKNRTDREKIDKRTKAERQQYRASAPTTFLEEVAYCPMSRLALNDPAPSASPDHSVLAALEDFLSSSCNQHSVDLVPHVAHPTPPSLRMQQPLPSSASSFRERVVVEQQIRPLSPSLQVQQQQCKRSAQDDEVGLDMGLSEISLVGGKTHLQQVNGSAPLMPPPVKNGRLFEQRVGGVYCGNELSTLVRSDVNVDALPFSRCEISENRTSTSNPSSSFRPIFSFPAPSATVLSANDNAVFKQPHSQLPSSQKRGTTPGDDEILCPGTCSSCGRACSSSFSFVSHRQYSGSHSLSDMSQEWSVKRQRRKRQSISSSWHKTTSDYSSQTLDEDNVDGQHRRPSTSSETSQALPSDEKSSKPPSQTTKSEGEDNDEEDFGEEGDDERSEGGCGVPNTLPEDSPATPTSLQIDATPSGTPTARTGVVPRSGANTVSNYGRKARPAFRADMSRTAVSCWLRAAGFGSLRSKFAKFTGADMLRLSRRDLVLMCGTVEGIRLSNALLQKPPRATCTIFVRKDSESVFQAIYLYQQTESELRIRLSSYLKLSVSPQNFSLVLKKSPNVDIAVNDEMVAYFDDQSCYTVKVSETNPEDKVTIFMSKI